MQCYNVGFLLSVWNWVLNCCCVCYDPEIEVNVMSTDTTSGTTGFTLPPETLRSANWRRSKDKCEARATGNELEAQRTMGERKRRGKAFSPSLCPLHALVPQKRETSGNEAGFHSFFCKVNLFIFTAGTCKIHCFNLTGRKMRKATNSRTAKKNPYPAVILCLQTIWWKQMVYPIK